MWHSSKLHCIHHSIWVITMNNFRLWLLGLPVSVPLGLIISYLFGALYSCMKYFDWYGIRNFRYNGLLTESIPVMMIVFAFVIIGVAAFNFKRFFIDGQTDFNPLRHISRTAVSDDKTCAQNRPIPPEFLSKIPSDLTIGKYRRKFVTIPFLESPEHQFIFGAPGSRKTSIILNALISFFTYHQVNIKSVLAVDAKPELAMKSVCEDREDVIIIDPTSYRGAGFNVWYGLDQSCSDDQLMDRISVIARALIPTLSNDNIHFSDNAQNLFIGFIMYGFRKGLGFCESVVNVKRSVTQDYIAEVCADPDMKSHPKIVGTLHPYQDNDSDEFRSIEDTMKKNLTIFEMDSVRYCFSDNDVKAEPHDLLDGKSIFLTIPDHLLEQYKYLFGMILELCTKELMSVDELLLKGQPPVWLLFDEAGSIYLPSLHDAISRARSKHLQVTVIAQNFQQLKALYGADKADSIYSGCKTKIVLACDNVSTARDISALVGNYRETKVSRHKNGPLNIGANSKNISEEYRPIMDVSDIYELEDRNKLLVLIRGQWFLADKCTYKDIPEFDEISDEIQQYNVRLHEPERPVLPAISGVEKIRQLIENEGRSEDD